jgi:hypothetical protein
MFVHGIRFRRGLAFGVIIIAALLAFEIFNYSTTDYALADLLGDLSFLGVRWATILAIAFCGIDFAGIARLFTPEDGGQEAGEVWYLFGAWLLAATMNAMLTWWGVSLAVLNHEALRNTVIERETLLRVVPIFVAVLVWLIRVLIIGTFSLAGERLFTQANEHTFHAYRPAAPVRQAVNAPSMSAPALAPENSAGQRPASRSNRIPSPKTDPVPLSSAAYHPAPKPSAQPSEPAAPSNNRPEPTYHPADPTYQPLSASAPSRTRRPQNDRPYGNSRSLNNSERR